MVVCRIQSQREGLGLPQALCGLRGPSGPLVCYRVAGLDVLGSGVGGTCGGACGAYFSHSSCSVEYSRV